MSDGHRTGRRSREASTRVAGVLGRAPAGGDLSPVSCADCAGVGDLCGILRGVGRDQIQIAARPVELAPGARLLSDGEPADQLYTLIEGILRLFKSTADGRRQIIGFAVDGDLIGLPGLARHRYHVEAVTRSRVCRLARTDLEAMLRESPGLAWAAICRASGDLARAQDQMLLLGRKTAEERVASFLLACCTRQQAGAGCRLDLPMSRRDIADCLGLRTESICRVLRRLDCMGAIKLTGAHGITLLDLDRLTLAAAA